MPVLFQRIALTGKPGDAAVAEVIAELATLLGARGTEVRVDAGVGAAVEAPSVAPYKLAEWADLVVCVGGDGSLLHAARQFGPAGRPLLGVNLGRLGFLVDLSRTELEKRVDELLAGRFIEEQRPLLEMTARRQDQVLGRQLALNDIVLHKADPGRLQEFSVHINGVGVTTHRADGIIIATPTGSTAYALSAGGPILHPSLGAIAIVPICPHTLSDRPLVVGNDSAVAVSVGAGTGGARVSCDGQPGLALAFGDLVDVVGSEQFIRLLHPPDYDYYRILRDKLHWGRAPGPTEG